MADQAACTDAVRLGSGSPSSSRVERSLLWPLDLTIARAISSSVCPASEEPAMLETTGSGFAPYVHPTRAGGAAATPGVRP